jgi:hypothetical protein
MPDKDIKISRQMASPPSYAKRLRAVEVVAKRVGFTHGEDGHFRRPGSEMMHRDADGRPIIEIEDER